MAAIVAIVNQKGGSGKSSAAASLGAALIQRGHSVAMVDVDPQAGLSLLRADVKQVGPRELASTLQRLAASDFVIVDTAPNLEQARIASDLADGLIIPTRLSYVDLRGLANLLAVIDHSKIVGVVAVATRLHVSHHMRILERIEGLGLGCPIVAVPMSCTAADAALLGKDVFSYPPAKRLAESYSQLARGVEQWATQID